ncbi:10679_t:CDS:2 [Funneliformis mosseae]|uniref:10679_t:CDS:1 n=1 Tax=Funneliformis mosseae TaxID=27381 RepID=A0A9N8ZKR4_FUNMO|nr:10679_t:CDS:2 [Funneliformis mosseae]
MVLIVPDKRLFTIILFIAFANNDFMPSFREIWSSPWVTAAAIGLTGLVVAAFILSAIISALGFGTEGIAASSFAVVLANYLDEMKLNEPEQQSFENFVRIEEKPFSNDHSMVIFTLLPALLCNQLMLKCFIEHFNFNESRVESLLIKDQIVGYGLDINDYQTSNVMLYILEEIWRQINVKGDIKSKYTVKSVKSIKSIKSSSFFQL